MVKNNRGLANMQAGDTIVEVLISMAVVALALGTGYAVSTRSFHSGLDASERSEALAHAQGQIELLKDAASTPLTINNIKTQTDVVSNPPGSGRTPFCIPDNPSVSNPQVGVLTSGSNCVSFDNTPYQIDIQYDSITQVFDIATSWDAIGGAGSKSYLNLYYKTP